jgi:hypothetical protein
MSPVEPEIFYVDDDVERLRHAVCEYLESVSQGLSKMAFVNGLDSLAVLFDMAREDAKRIRAGSDEHVDRP